MATFADRAASEGITETYQYVVGGSAFHLAVDDGSIALVYGRSANPAVTLSTDEQTFADMAAGKTTASAAAAAGTLTLTGDREAVRRLARIFSRSTVLATAEEIVIDASAGSARRSA
jgi:putative sterol carrier protein